MPQIDYPKNNNFICFPSSLNCYPTLALVGNRKFIINIAANSSCKLPLQPSNNDLKTDEKTGLFVLMRLLGLFGFA